MKDSTIATFLVLLTLFATSCDSKKEANGEEDRAAIREAVLQFTKKPRPREPGEHYQHVINTSKGRLFISSQEWKTGENGVSAFSGPSRPDGYFLYPRMEWASSPDEAIELLLSDYEAGNFAPAPTPQETQAPDSEGGSVSQPGQTYGAEQGGAGQPATPSESE